MEERKTERKASKKENKHQMIRRTKKGPLVFTGRRLSSKSKNVPDGEYNRYVLYRTKSGYVVRHDHYSAWETKEDLQTDAWHGKTLADALDPVTHGTTTGSKMPRLVVDMVEDAGLLRYIAERVD